MRTPRKHFVGDVISDRVIISVNGRHAQLECLKCGKIVKGTPSDFFNRYCPCRKKESNRYSGKVYKNSKEKLQSIKEKYKNGVTDEIMKEFMNNLM